MRAVSERFGVNLLSAREAAGLSQEELSFLSGLHRTAVGQIERGTRIPRIDTLAKLCGALEIEYAVLMAGIYWSPPTLRGGGFGVAKASQ